MTHQEVGKRARHFKNALPGKKIIQSSVPRSKLKQLPELSTSVILSNSDPIEIPLLFGYQNLLGQITFTQMAAQGESHLVRVESRKKRDLKEAAYRKKRSGKMAEAA